MWSDDLLHERLSVLAESSDHPNLNPEVLLGRYRAQRRRRRSARAAAGVGMLIAGASGAAVVWPGTPADIVRPYFDGAGPRSSVFTPASGRDWLLDTPTPTHPNGTPYDPEDEDDLPTPSERPHREAPYAELSAGLLAEVNGAGLPAGTQLVPNKGSGYLAAYRITLPNGTPMMAMRGRYTHPIRFRASSADGVGHQIRLVDVPGTSSAALIDPVYGYGFPRAHRTPTTNGVVIVTREGVTTMWAAPSAVSMDQLKAWAFRAARATSK